ncbi:MAG TPA: hypothetical protein VJN39_14805 [Gemmatimonadales bacterium]|nr:hypothetical protein [Gemmatimonadales bacterium]
MALNIYEWTRTAPGPFTSTGFPNDVFVLLTRVTSPFSAFVPWTLIRTEAELVVSAFFPAGSGPQAAQEAASNLRLGLKWTPDTTDPGMDRNDTSEGVLGQRHLVGSVAGDPGGVAASSATWRLLTPFENRTRRSAGATEISAVWAYVYWLTAPDAAEISMSIQLSALWGRSG